jgi:hypothetical protein
MGIYKFDIEIQNDTERDLHWSYLCDKVM